MVGRRELDGRWRGFHPPTVALWTCLGALIALTSTLALQAGVEALYLVVTGWIIGPFFLYWLYKKVRRGSGGGG